MVSLYPKDMSEPWVAMASLYLINSSNLSCVFWPSDWPFVGGIADEPFPQQPPPSVANPFVYELELGDPDVGVKWGVPDVSMLEWPDSPLLDTPVVDAFEMGLSNIAVLKAAPSNLPNIRAYSKVGFRDPSELKFG